LPSQESAARVPPLLEKGVRIIDMSADFRLREASAYPAWYGFQHPATQWLGQAVYGLPERYRERIKTAQLVANPGCYPTSAILALAPALQANLIERDIILDSKSGVSGAGRALSLRTHFCEVDDGVSAYGLEGHRHLPEIVQELEAVSGTVLDVTFVPHLVPMTRGILTAAYAGIVPGRLPMNTEGLAELRRIYTEFYAGEPFVRIMAAPPSTKHTRGSNYCFIYPTLDIRTGRLIVISCIDNLVKGAAGQAVQNMNLMLGFPETMGLESLAVYP
ncbi:MAG: N-acetyl-gamma-glutamyl-phosphate reductase, partial [Chloroflexi bacterium]|nr:N-acetyl-gamma-glutamyl-phosphate reductase [Chloroflexota bacterium]